ncbi:MULTISPECIES: cell division protein ZapA [unclassified Pseudomonas]|uniref:cell division protein ZapA n=1 Tax=unclassified Pseudomonas TaxID=196821 RepID=UPI000BD9CC40|nr:MULTISPECIES: cell division protein ZapA [unclassified Pseudomonas]PVZ10392.1 cell division protein ZapA [Pseudomonas sp. URIL14HWK12:I12]PVZ21818.1 cell division protein ZapA [Pseudomonas sp. URIL14HWK12:I10]PVZ31099.1 cell division protein ZapA [Pseudomonas sp. URIL14HWK12:I11]SNZ17750.1 cell division protein ZapA [Pseudomonas sp. URIL14HWK12:I9]
MSSSNSVTVQILDKEYSIMCPPQERGNLLAAARYLDGKMREIRSGGKVIGGERIAVMAALNIAHDLLNRKDSPDLPASGATRDQVRSLLERVDLALAPDQEPPKG